MFCRLCRVRISSLHTDGVFSFSFSLSLTSAAGPTPHTTHSNITKHCLSWAHQYNCWNILVIIFISALFLSDEWQLELEFLDDQQWLDSFHLFWVVYDVCWLCMVMDLCNICSDGTNPNIVLREELRDSTELCPDLSCLTTNRVELVVAWREERVFSLSGTHMWLYKLWIAGGRCWEKPVISAWHDLW